MDIIYEGICLMFEQIVNCVVEDGVYVVGLLILLGSYMLLIEDLMNWMQDVGLQVLVVVGGIILDDDVVCLCVMGVVWVYILKDFELNCIMMDIVVLVLFEEVVV